MSRSSTPDTQIWRPDQSSDARTQDQPLQFWPRNHLKRRPSAESYSTVGSFTLDDTQGLQRTGNNVLDSQRNSDYRQRVPIRSYEPRRPSADSFSLEDSIDIETTALPPVGHDNEAGPSLRKRTSVESFQTTGSFALDEVAARQWEIEHGWDFVQPAEPRLEHLAESRTPAPRNFSRPLRTVDPPQPPEAQPVPHPNLDPTVSSSESTLRNSLGSRSSSSSSSASSIVLRPEDYPVSSQTVQLELKNVPPVSVEHASKSQELTSIEELEEDAVSLAPNLVSRPPNPAVSVPRPLQPTRKQVSFEHSRAPPPSLQDYVSDNASINSTDRASITSMDGASTKIPQNHAPPSSNIQVADDRPSTSSTTTSRRSAESSTIAQSLRSTNTIGSGGSGSAGSNSSISTQPFAEGWSASNYDVSSIPLKQLEKLKKKGIDPALWLEMKAATAKSNKDHAKGSKKGGLFKRGRPLVGNAFIG